LQFINLTIRLKTYYKILLISFIFIANIAFCYSQDEIDTAKVESTVKRSKFEMTKSPSGAIYRSLVLPGWGQWYVESYWKAPIFLAGALGLYGSIIYNQIEFSNYAEILDGMEKDNPDYQITLLRREYFRDNRDMSGFYLIGVYVLAAVDAYVGAHLFDFEVDENLSIGFIPHSLNPRVAVFIRF
jgi:hypothetical protein